MQSRKLCNAELLSTFRHVINPAVVGAYSVDKFTDLTPFDLRPTLVD